MRCAALHNVRSPWSLECRDSYVADSSLLPPLLRPFFSFSLPDTRDVLRNPIDAAEHRLRNGSGGSSAEKKELQVDCIEGNAFSISSIFVSFSCFRSSTCRTYELWRHRQRTKRCIRRLSKMSQVFEWRIKYFNKWQRGDTQRTGLLLRALIGNTSK